MRTRRTILPGRTRSPTRTSPRRRRRRPCTCPRRSDPRPTSKKPSSDSTPPRRDSNAGRWRWSTTFARRAGCSARGEGASARVWRLSPRRCTATRRRFPRLGRAAAARTGWKSLTAASRRSRRSGRHEPADPPNTGRRWRRRGGTSTRLAGTWPSCTSECRGPRLRTSQS